MQDLCYPMDHEKVGHALIINNVSAMQPGSNVDMRSLEQTYREMGLTIRVETDLREKVTRASVRRRRAVSS